MSAQLQYAHTHLPIKYTYFYWCICDSSKLLLFELARIWKRNITDRLIVRTINPNGLIVL